MTQTTQTPRSRRRRRHAARCKHWHRCEQHRSHTCRHKHRCPHRHHRAPAPTTPAPKPGAPTPTTVTPVGVPDAFALHLGNRLGYGMTPALHADMAAAGGAEAWFERQLDPAGVPDAAADQVEAWWPSLTLTATDIATRNRDGVESGSAAMANYARWCLLRRILSRRQVFEAMTEFWEHHLHVPLLDDSVYPYRAAYGRVIRQHALGRFDRMLTAATTHPAMIVSLDNQTSVRKAPNENLGRELLELHTVGLGNHTEDDVKNSARILTGFRIKSYEPWYDAANHWTGPVKVLGFEHANASSDGRPVAEAYLGYLARHPHTARRLARKLAVRFVSDAPSQALVDHLAEVYLAHDTEIRPVLRALVASAEFRASAGAKVRTPTDDVVATARVLGVAFAPPASSSSGANRLLDLTTNVGQRPFIWSRPDGQPQDNRSWSSSTRLMASFAMHWGMATGSAPKAETTYRSKEAWLPAPAVRFADLVDHLSRHLLARPASPRVLRACCVATSTDPSATVTATHAVVKSRFGTLLATLLDTPEHLHR